MISFERAEEIAEAYYDDVYRFCFSRIQNEEEASEVTQDVFLLFQEKCDELNDDKIRAWLYSVANNKLKEKSREIAEREKRLIFGITSGLKSEDELTYEMEYEENITDEEIDEKKSEIISSLSEKELELFMYVYSKHMKYSRLAETLGVSEASLRTRVSRLNAKIKAKVYRSFMVVLLVFMKI